MGFFSNLFKKKAATTAPKAKGSKTQDLIASYLQDKQENGKMLNAKDYFAQDLVDNCAEEKFENALRNILGAKEVEPCGNSLDIDWNEQTKSANISTMIFDFNADGINVTLYVNVDGESNDSIEIWVGEVDEPNASIDLDSYPDNATSSNCIYENAAQKVKQYLQSSKLI